MNAGKIPARKTNTGMHTGKRRLKVYSLTMVFLVHNAIKTLVTLVATVVAKKICTTGKKPANKNYSAPPQLHVQQTRRWRRVLASLLDVMKTYCHTYSLNTSVIVCLAEPLIWYRILIQAAPPFFSPFSRDKLNLFHADVVRTCSSVIGPLRDMSEIL